MSGSSGSQCEELSEDTRNGVKVADTELVDIYAQIESLRIATHQEAVCKDNGRLELMAERLDAQCERLRSLSMELEELAEKWEEYGTAPDEACASELREVLDRD